jgi:hypothetical protein
MRKLVVTKSLTLDGVMHAPGVDEYRLWFFPLYSAPASASSPTEPFRLGEARRFHDLHHRHGSRRRAE